MIEEHKQILAIIMKHATDFMIVSSIIIVIFAVLFYKG